MFDLYIDFDAIRERAYDYVQFAAGAVIDVVESAIDVVEDAVEALNEAVQ